MRWRIRRIVNGCAAQLLVARRDVIAPEFISYGLVPGNQQKALSQAGLTIQSSRRRFASSIFPWAPATAAGWLRVFSAPKANPRPPHYHQCKPLSRKEIDRGTYELYGKTVEEI
jgi:hypothetical protein